MRRLARKLPHGRLQPGGSHLRRLAGHHFPPGPAVRRQPRGVLLVVPEQVLSAQRTPRIAPPVRSSHASRCRDACRRAEEIFTGATKTVEDRHRIYGEARYITIGYLDERMVILVWTRRQRPRRVIRMRKANGREQARYAPDIRR